ncbi:unnamed protein product [Rotaria socialis]|uniref:Uncharacterized protein n=3 Tax=Rotaria socialis TaxID=392032 RepID=A0A817Q2Y3_9BILA|nr:unnamed protein product [Rotaria socialis]CAF3495077.1 unnamed protein product [Rotaria socialis]CAF3725818.1 unnamed protein product [Rotaria socialis]CAF4263887.1 unnamed protein product [Rotaria socialis]CAF4321203.1 unnamed protein product [Rotaria socialis]
MATPLDYGYLLSPTGQLNIVEIFLLIGALISVAFTSSVYCELVDRIQFIYPGLNTALIRYLFQSFAVLCLTFTIIILIVHIYGIRYLGGNYYYTNQFCVLMNICMGLIMISIGIFAAFWEDKLRRIPDIIRRGYLSTRYQYLHDEITHQRPCSVAATAIFGMLAGILFIVEAGTRSMSNANSINMSNRYTSPALFQRAPIKIIRGERVTPIETTTALYQFTRV